MSNILLIAPIPALAELREAVLARSEKRKPKWGFRVAPNIVLELQAQPCALLSERSRAAGYKQVVVKFEGRAVMIENAREAHLKSHTHGARLRKFTLIQFAGEPEWRLVLGGWRRPLNDDPQYLEQLYASIPPALQDGGIFTRLTPEQMLRAGCMICGKGLTDPASMARWIGPEYAATTSVRVFWAARTAGGTS